MDDTWAVRRKKLVEKTLRSQGLIDERMLAAMARVPRHLFVIPEKRELSYEDIPLPFREEQTISQPYIVALMTELLVLKGDESVLEIGTGTGYQTAVLAELAREIFTVERIGYFVTDARSLLTSMGYENITFCHADGTLGWPEERLFDRIIVTAAPPELPVWLERQLAPGGYMVIPIGPVGGTQHLYRYHKPIGGGMIRDRIIPVRFVPLVNG
jgi:protein-L-isoaspartate(D-aspartate) O-methyltransferase